MLKHFWHLVAFYVFLEANSLCLGLKIMSLSVPGIVQSNASEVILDCNYFVEDWERLEGFVLKWYINSVNLVYQWIPPMAPQDLGSLRGRLDISYEASKDKFKKHRALKILDPDPSLSGIYSCTVSSFEGEDNDSANLLIWSPPVEVKLKYWRPAVSLVNISCSAFDVSPKPTFKLYHVDPFGTRQDLVIHWRSDEPGSIPGLYESHSYGVLHYERTKEGSIIGCTVFTKEKLFEETREIIYHTGLPIITTTSTTTQMPDEEAIRSPNIASLAISLHSLRGDGNLVLLLCSAAVYRSFNKLCWTKIVLLFLICKII